MRQRFFANKLDIRFRILTLAIIAITLITACCKPTGKSTDTTTSPAPVVPTNNKKALSAGLLITPQGLNDKGFNDLANKAMKQAAAKGEIDDIIIEPSTINNPEASITFFAAQNFDLIIAVGAAYQDTVIKLAANNPATRFAIIDSDVKKDNVLGVSFKEEEGAYLCGYLAGKMTKTGKVGFIGGVKTPVISRFYKGFANGVASTGKEVEILEKYIATDFKGFNNPTVGNEIAKNMYENGYDVIFAPAGASTLGIISAAVEKQGYVIGVDTNQDSLAPGLVLTSMVKRVDKVVEDILNALIKNEPLSSIKTSYGLSDGGISLTDFALSRQAVGNELIAELKDIETKIISGEIDPLGQSNTLQKVNGQ